MNERKVLVAATLVICASSSKNISIYNEEMIVALCFIGFIVLSRQSFGQTLKETFEARIAAIQEELQQVPNPNEVVPIEANEEQRLRRISLQTCATVVEALPTERCAPKCEKAVQAILCRNLNAKSETLLTATDQRRSQMQSNYLFRMRRLLRARFSCPCVKYAERVKLLRESLAVLRMRGWGGARKNK